MKTRHPIMVNGRILQEYVKDKEEIDAEIKSNQFLRDGFDGVALNRHIKEKYPDQIEENGEVVKLGQFEINRANKDRMLSDAVKAADWKSSFIIAMMTQKTNDFVKLVEIVKQIIKFAKANNIPINEKSMRHAMRGASGFVRKSKLSEFMEIHGRESRINNSAVTIFRMKPEGKEIPLKRAIELGMQLLKEGKTPPKPKKIEQNMPKTVKNDVQLPEKELIEPKAEEITTKGDSSISDIVNTVLRLTSEKGALFHFDGDLVININIGSKD